MAGVEGIAHVASPAYFPDETVEPDGAQLYFLRGQHMTHLSFASDHWTRSERDSRDLQDRGDGSLREAHRRDWLMRVGSRTA